MKTSNHALRHPLAWAASLALCLGGCGGGDVEEASSDAVAQVISPLLADDGSVMPSDPRAVPMDHAARTRQQRYATAAQAEMLAHALRGDVIDLTVDCCGNEALELATLTAYGLQAAQDLPDSAPVFVRGADLRQAAHVADRLAEGGLSRVFLVTR
jgi:hypothetical protein